MAGMTILLLFIVAIILLYVIPPEDYHDFESEHEAMSYRTQGEWDDEDKP